MAELDIRTEREEINVIRVAEDITLIKISNGIGINSDDQEVVVEWEEIDDLILGLQKAKEFLT